jgi:hypothetical protein
MAYIHTTSRDFVFGLILAVLSGIMVMGFTQTASAQDRGSRQREFTAPRPQNTPQHTPSYKVPGSKQTPSYGAPRSQHIPSYRDSRYHHNRSYPVRGHYVRAVPRGYYGVYHGGVRYRYYGGTWYRPYGSYFTVVAPPFGLVVPFLPLYYTTLWVGGVPYYYANDVYYTHTTGGYVVVEPPKGEVVQAPQPEEKLFIYPREGQSEKQQSDDRYECHRWAVDETHFDPTQPPGSVPEAEVSKKYGEYRRAMGACLDARGYTVK